MSEKVVWVGSLLCHHGDAFIDACYLEILGRAPDAEGKQFYLGRLAMGVPREDILIDIAKSKEAQARGVILRGLEHLQAQQRKAKHWFWRWLYPSMLLQRALFNVGDRLAYALSETTQEIRHLSHQVSAQHVVNERIAQQLSVLQNPALTEPPLGPQIPVESVRRMFQSILGRDPESEETIRQHARLPNEQALRDTLLNSEEFQLRVAALPEYARILLLRQIHTRLVFQEF